MHHYLLCQGTMSVNKLQEADHLRREGNDHYEDFRYTEAIKMYVRASQIYEQSGYKKLGAKTWCNMSLAHLKLNEPENSLECAKKAIQLDATYCKAYYRRAQALEKLKKYQCCVNDYVSSNELQPQRNTFYLAVKVAATHGVPLRGMTVTKSYQSIVEESGDHTLTTRYSSNDVMKLCTAALDKHKLGVLPIFRFILKAEVSCNDIVVTAMKHTSSEVKRMIASITNYSECIKKELEGQVAKLRETRVMGAELIRAAIEEESSRLAEMFLEALEIEGGVIDISELLQRKALWYHPDWVRKMFTRGADLQLCRHNPLKVVIQREYTQHCLKLDMIRILIENGSAFPFDIPHIQILNEVVECTLKCRNGTVDTLTMVCENADFSSQEVCDHEGRTPWHIALGGKLNKVSIEVCKVLSKYPVDPRKTDRNGKLADFGLKENDERVRIMRATTDALMQSQKELATVAPLRKQKRLEIMNVEWQRLSQDAQASVGGTESEVVDFHTTETNTVSLSLNKAKESTATTMGTTTSCSYSIAQEYNGDIVPKQFPTPESENDNRDNTESDKSESVFAGGDNEAQEGIELTIPDEYAANEVCENLSGNLSQTRKSQGATAADDAVEHEVWTIEYSKKVEKVLRQSDEYIKKQFRAKLKMLSEGEFMGNKRHCKPVTARKGAELYATRLSDKDRIIWQIIPKMMGVGTYREIIRVWAVVLDHDNIHHCVETILRDKEFLATEKLKAQLKCTPQTTSNVHNNKREPRTFVADTSGTPDESTDSTAFFTVTDL